MANFKACNKRHITFNNLININNAKAVSLERIKLSKLRWRWRPVPEEDLIAYADDSPLGCLWRWLVTGGPLLSDTGRKRDVAGIHWLSLNHRWKFVALIKLIEKMKKRMKRGKSQNDADCDGLLTWWWMKFLNCFDSNYQRYNVSLIVMLITGDWTHHEVLMPVIWQYGKFAV